MKHFDLLQTFLKTVVFQIPNPYDAVVRVIETCESDSPDN
jgi:hypothetical protein